MNSDIDIGKLALSIMEHPELIEKIKSLATENSKEEKSEISASTAGETNPPPRRNNSKRRSALLHSLQPYLNDKRKGAIETMITVFDVIDAVIYK